METSPNIPIKLFKTILQDKEVTPPDCLEILKTVYSFDNHEASATEVAKELGYKTQQSVNMKIIGFGKRIAKEYQITPHQREDGSLVYYDFFFNYYLNKRGSFFLWKLTDNLTRALEEFYFLNKTQMSPERSTQAISIAEQTYIEGAATQVLQTRYERKEAARIACINHWGCKCSVCERDFEKRYGEIGKGFIQVHHLKPLSTVGEGEINPIEDLRPVCPNCHAMLHKRTPEPFTIEELKSKLKSD